MCLRRIVISSLMKLLRRSFHQHHQLSIRFTLISRYCTSSVLIYAVCTSHLHRVFQVLSAICMPYAYVPGGCSSRGTNRALRFRNFQVKRGTNEIWKQWVSAEEQCTTYSVFSSKHYTANCYFQELDLEKTFDISAKRKECLRNAQVEQMRSTSRPKQTGWR